MSSRSLFAGAALTATALLTVAAPAAQAATPTTVAKKFFAGFVKKDQWKMADYATVEVVEKSLKYKYRAPDKFAGCTAAGTCRFVYTSVKVPGDLNGLLLQVKGNKVVKAWMPQHMTKPGSAAHHFVQSWWFHDKNRAREVATAKAVKTLFKVKWDPNGVPYHWQGCSKEPKGYSCAYSYEGGAMFLHVRGTKAAGYYVNSVSYIAD
ncbi:hypothetical protein FDA94_16240 [Herbidospora galbida]|uniref:Uncharacterized protein n=1 Tax=Herbidospora galbida TaxID=2575442 RepID=A0A4U3MGL4_9ACTN|nr:hypothetical protein [Herbidospora galbida]TKK87729.1 hypothetical protein FDA94_16240 [Herbidospora galbida]